MRGSVFTLAAMVLFGAVASFGDGGMIPFNPRAQVFEPRQRAIIAWNGREEILILSTDTYASESTKGLEIVPLRAEPTVKLADPGIFVKTLRLLEAKTTRGLPPNLRAPFGGSPSGAAAPVGEIVQHERMGRHNVAVTHVLNVGGFSAWAEEYLRSQGADTPTVPDWILAAIQDYLQRGFNWFVYDVIDLETYAHANDPIQFRFKSDCVFYPLVITQTENREVDIQILLFTTDFLWSYPELPKSNIRVGRQQNPTIESIGRDTAYITRQELRDLSTDIAALFGQQSGIKLRTWTLTPENPMRGRFVHDLVAR